MFQVLLTIENKQLFFKNKDSIVWQNPFMSISVQLGFKYTKPKQNS